MLPPNLVYSVAELIYTLLRKVRLFRYLSRLAIVFFTYIPVPLVSTSDHNLFVPAFGTIDEIYSRKVYDRIFGPKKEWTVVDIGAAFGIYALRASKMVGKNGLVIAIEPDPINFKFLKHHIKLNRVSNIVPVNSAVGDRVGTVKLYQREALSHSINRPYFGCKYIMVKMLTFDYLMRSLNIDHIDLLKVDVEGAELEVLKGIKETFVERITMEYHGKEKVRQVSHLLESRGYDVLIRRVGVKGEIGYLDAFLSSDAALSRP